MLSTIYFASLMVTIYMSVWFLVSIIIKRNDVADVAWGLGFIVASLSALIFNHNYNYTSIITVILIIIWGGRLAVHIGLRNLKKSEDYRYKAYRDNWGKTFYIRSFFQIYVLQGLLMLIIASPVLIISHYSTKITSPFLVLGVIAWVYGFVFESIADRQLANFIQNKNKSKRVLDTGLWRFSRHPNYYGELTQWWAIGIICLGVKYGYFGLIGPAVISFLIIKVSGIPMLEKRHLDDDQYIAYRKATSILIPRPPRN